MLCDNEIKPEVIFVTNSKNIVKRTRQSSSLSHFSMVWKLIRTGVGLMTKHNQRIQTYVCRWSINMCVITLRFLLRFWNCTFSKSPIYKGEINVYHTPKAKRRCMCKKKPYADSLFYNIYQDEYSYNTVRVDVRINNDIIVVRIQ